MLSGELTLDFPAVQYEWLTTSCRTPKYSGEDFTTTKGKEDLSAFLEFGKKMKKKHIFVVKLCFFQKFVRNEDKIYSYLI